MLAPKNSRSRPIGATIGLLFAGLWCVLGSQALGPRWQIPAMALGWLVSATLIARLWRGPAVPGGGTAMFGRRAYLVAVVLEVAALFAAVNLLPRYGAGDELVPAVGVVVGLHFIGLWKATGLDRFLWIAGAMCAVSALAALLPPGLREAVCGFGNALVLWIGAGKRSL